MVFMRSILDVVPSEVEEDQEIAPVLSHSKSYIEEFLESTKQEDNNEKRNCISDNDFVTVLGMEYGNMILEIEEGALVGEKALIENKPRAATICTKSPCELLILLKYLDSRIYLAIVKISAYIFMVFLEKILNWSNIATISSNPKKKNSSSQDFLS